MRLWARFLHSSIAIFSVSVLLSFRVQTARDRAKGSLKQRCSLNLQQPKEIRIPANQGIAGFVATSGE